MEGRSGSTTEARYAIIQAGTVLGTVLSDYMVAFLRQKYQVLSYGCHYSVGKETHRFFEA